MTEMDQVAKRLAAIRATLEDYKSEGKASRFLIAHDLGEALLEIAERATHATGIWNRRGIASIGGIAAMVELRKALSAIISQAEAPHPTQGGGGK